MKKMIKFIKGITKVEWLLFGMFFSFSTLFISKYINSLALFIFAVIVFIFIFSIILYFTVKASKEARASEFENALGYKDLYKKYKDLYKKNEDLYKKNEDLMVENFKLRSDCSKKDLLIEEFDKQYSELLDVNLDFVHENTKLRNDKKILDSLLMNVKDPNCSLIKILLENKDFLKMCDDLLIDGEKKHPDNDWKEIDFAEHFKKAKGHLAKEVKGEISDHCSPHGVSAFVRIMFAMINKYKK